MISQPVGEGWAIMAFGPCSTIAFVLVTVNLLGWLTICYWVTILKE
jgi:hypothetical protein